MALVDFEALKTPVSEQLPCGPDLDFEGDPGYMNLVARIEGLLPESFFAFDRSTIDFKAEIEALGALLQRTRDLRLLTILAKLLILDRNLSGFAACAGVMASLLKEHWREVHPSVTGGDTSLRTAVLQTLDDLPSTILPLQYLPLVQSRRAGAISYRSHMIVAGEVARRAQEDAPDRAAIEFAISEAELPELIATRDAAERMQRAVAQIRLACIENAGFAEAPSLERLTPLTENMLALLDGFVAVRDPRAAIKAERGPDRVGDADPGLARTPEIAGFEGAGTQVRPGQVATTQDAAAVLASVIAYLALKEPSSPSLLLVRQAEQLVGKSFVEIIRILVPEIISDAKISVGAEQPIAFPFERLAMLMPEADGLDPTGSSQSKDQRRHEVRTRAEAMALLEQVAEFYRGAEPSNPIPLLIERARALSTIDFLSLLREIAPKRK